MEVDTILKEIGKYSFTKEDLFPFLLQERKKFSAFSFYKHMLLEIIESTSLEELIASFYHLEYGANSNEIIEVRLQNREVKHTLKELNILRSEKIKKVMDDFVNGKGKYLQEVLEYGNSLGTTSLLYTKVKEKVEKLLREYESILEKMAVQDNRILELRKAKKEQQNKLKNKGPLEIVTKKVKHGKDIEVKHTYKFFKKTAVKRYALKIDKKIENIKKEKNILNNEIHSLFLQFEALFKEENIEGLWNLALKKHTYYNKKKSLREIINHLINQGESYFSIVDDMYACSKVIQNYFKLNGYVRNGNSFMFVCKKIREIFLEVGLLSESDMEDGGIRKIDIKDANEFYSVPDFTELPQKIDVLTNQYSKVLSLKEPVSFVKKCSEFHFDFLWTQPFLEENKRTARVLLTLMLSSHNIFIPFKYVIKKEYASGIYKTYGEVETDLLARYSYFYKA